MSKFKTTSLDGIEIIYPKDVLKHLPGGHDQKEHGSWATGGGGVHLSENTAQEIEASKALFQEILGPDNDLVETLTGYGYQSDLDYEKLKGRLTRRYQEAGMGKNTAILQARIDMGRVQYAINNEKQEALYQEVIAKQKAQAADPNDEYAKGSGDVATAMEKNLEYAKGQASEILKNGTVTMAATEGAFESILADGRYKNQFETRTSGGKLDTGVRKVGEGLATATPAGTKLADRPVYGFLTNNETVHSYQSINDAQSVVSGPNRENWLGANLLGTELSWQRITSINNDQVDQYGEIRFTLKPEVRSRTTATIGDSLRTGNMADAVNNPKPDLVNMGLYNEGAVHHLSGNPSADYVEAQIHGGVKVSDISHIYAPAGRVDAVKAMVAAQGLDIPVSARAGA
ncbi:hypothetical protein UFOVP655_9 [uncultured Caudovirales phage]|uniref:Uncharacterized protein n=1 Tax=uncultured Caudovirales phage TaxID=2100421 RepID=A0A6J5NAI4_9CAUD|nr:hypothetical protein UFOVP655_9 [uncultured Caudovirales phage]